MKHFYWYFSWTRRDKFIGLRIGPIYFKFKPTSDELFSERNNLRPQKIFRFRGYSFIIGNSKRLSK